MEKCLLPDSASNVGGGFWMVMSRTFIGGKRAKGAWPCAISRMLIPKDQMSARQLYLHRAGLLGRSPWALGALHHLQPLPTSTRHSTAMSLARQDMAVLGRPGRSVHAHHVQRAAWRMDTSPVADQLPRGHG